MDEQQGPSLQGRSSLMQSDLKSVDIQKSGLLHLGGWMCLWVKLMSFSIDSVNHWTMIESHLKTCSFVQLRKVGDTSV